MKYKVDFFLMNYTKTRYSLIEKQTPQVRLWLPMITLDYTFQHRQFLVY